MSLSLDYDDSSEEDEDEEYEEIAVAAIAVAFVCAEEARIARAECRKPSRRYQRRAHLLPNPRRNTPWQALYESRDDRAYITTMGIDVDTFHYILDHGFAREWNLHPIPRPDANPTGFARLGRRSLDAAGALGLIYHFLSSAMPDTALQQIFALVPSTVSRYRSWAMSILLNVLRRSIPSGCITWWKDEDECAEDSALICARHPRLSWAIGSVDGLNILTAASDDPEVENGSYNGWLHGHYTSCVIVFSPRRMIKKAVLNAPGSWHDAKVARPIYDFLCHWTPEGYFLVADTAFPRGTSSIPGRIQAPMKANQVLPSNMAEREAMLAWDRQLLSYRQTAEWGMRQLHAGFGRLRIPLDINDPIGRSDLLEVCVRTKRVGISEIWNVYMRYWKEAEDEDIWNDFENVLFGDLRQRDRVSRFHCIAVEQ